MLSVIFWKFEMTSTLLRNRKNIAKIQDFFNFFKISTLFSQLIENNASTIKMKAAVYHLILTKFLNTLKVWRKKLFLRLCGPGQNFQNFVEKFFRPKFFVIGIFDVSEPL